MESIFVSLVTNKNISINILELFIPTDIYSLFIEKISKWSNFLKSQKWTMTFIDSWNDDNYYVILRNRSGTSFNHYKDELYRDINLMFQEYNNNNKDTHNPNTVGASCSISRNCVLPTLVPVDQLKKIPKKGEALADILMSLKIVKNI